MAVASWMIRHRSLRSGRSKSKISFEDEFKLDPSCNPIENAWRILTELCTHSISTSRRFSLLNAFVILAGSPAGYLAFQRICPLEDIFSCLRMSLVHECTQIRAGCLRAFRRIMKTQEHVRVFNDMQLPHLVSRCIDIVLKNEMERIQTFQLIRRLLILSPNDFSPILTRAMVSLGMGGSEQGERLLRACLAILCEIGILNPSQLIICGGVGVILHNILECHSPRIAESLVGVLLHLLENPESRASSDVRLEMLASPYCDFQYRMGILDKSKDARDVRITCSRLALLSVLRSWAGTLQFCDPEKESGLPSIVSVLYINQLEARKAVLDLLYELVGLPQPVWTDEYSVAVAALDPTDFQDQWRLNEGFVAAECRSILPTFVSTVPSPAEMHLAFVLYCLLESGILSALVEVIVASDTFISVRATILLGKLLNMIHILLPPDIYNTSPALPNLISYAASNKPQALAAITVLEHLNSIMECRPASASLFLDQILLSGNLCRNNGTLKLDRNVESAKLDNRNIQATTEIIDKGLKLPKISKVFQFFTSLKEAEDLLRDSNVLLDKDGATWNWDVVRAILNRMQSSVLDEQYVRFIHRLVDYFSPSCNRFSHQDLGHNRHSLHCVHAGGELLDWLIRATHPIYSELLLELFSDIALHVSAISKSKNAHECLFSPQHMLATLCQMYFLYIGRLCRYERGLALLHFTGIFSQFINLVKTTNHICYVKLIVSGMDYTLDSTPRKILAMALTSPITKSRLYATQFLIVLLRTKAFDFAQWGMPLLVKQIEDTDIGVSQAALEILTEACNDLVYLNKLIAIWPPLLSLGDPGRLLRTRLFSITKALEHLIEEGNAVDEINHWENFYNKRYVLIVESETHCSLTQNNRTADVTYSQRVNSARNSNSLVLPTLPPHLYGQLVQTEIGLALLSKQGSVSKMIQCVIQGDCCSEDEVLLLKSAIWVIGHMASHARGLKFLLSHCDCIIVKIIDLVKHCPVYSVRATAFFVLGLISSTCEGANMLCKLNWLCVRHNRNELWPITERDGGKDKSLYLCRTKPISRTSFIFEPSGRIITKHNRSTGFYHSNKNRHLSRSNFDPCDVIDRTYGSCYNTPPHEIRTSFSSDVIEVDSTVEGTSILESSSTKYNSQMQTSFISEHSAQDTLDGHSKSFYSEINIDDSSSFLEDRNKYNKNPRITNEDSSQINSSTSSNILHNNILHDDSLEDSKNTMAVDKNGPCYMGICLPVQIHDMFTHKDPQSNYINSMQVKSWSFLSEDLNDTNIRTISHSESIYDQANEKRILNHEGKKLFTLLSI